MAVAAADSGLEPCDEWIRDVHRKSSAPIILVLSKSDLRQKPLPVAVVAEWCRKRNISAFFEVSAKNGTGLKELLAGIDKILDEEDAKQSE